MSGVDRLGKGLRTAPRDSLISLSVPRDQLGFAFGVHRAMDAMGAMIGPILAFTLLALLPGAFDVSSSRAFLWRVDWAGRAAGFCRESAADRGRRRDDHRRPKPRLSGSWRLKFSPLLICATMLSLTTLSDAFVYLALQRELNLGPDRFRSSTW